MEVTVRSNVCASTTIAEKFLQNDIVVMEPKLKLAKALAPAQMIQSLRRNHISRLPVELLTDVFSYLLPETLAIDDVVEALETESDWCLHMRRKHGDIIHASHVCRSWRRICLSTPSFWSLIWFTDEDQFTPRSCEFVHRSGSVPLEVAIRDERSRDQRLSSLSGDEDDEVPFHGPLLHPLLSFFGQFPHSLQRMKSLRVCSRFPSHQDFTSYFKKPAPVLESFALYVDCLSNTGYEPIVLQLPIPLFDGTTPSLRKLSLDGAEVPWTSNIFNNLTFLRICRFESRREDDRVQLGQILQIIKNCPGIVSLELRFAGPVLPADYDKSPKTSQYTAPYLKNIILSGMMELVSVQAFLSSLRTPQLQTLAVGHYGLRILNIDEIVPQSVVFDPRSSLCNCIRIDVDPGCEWVNMEQFLVDDLEARMVTTPDIRYLSLRWLRETKSSFERRLHCMNDDERMFGFVGGDPVEYRALSKTFLGRLCPLPERTRAISFRGSDVALDEMSFRDIFGYFSNVNCVEVRYNLGFIDASAFMNYLRDEAGAADEFGATSVALQSVHLLIFDSVDFTPKNFNPLRSFLEHRKKRKAPISHVGLNYCKGIGRKRMATLKELVPSVCFVNEAIVDKDFGNMNIPESGYMIEEF